jgi:5'-nucleotidase
MIALHGPLLSNPRFDLVVSGINRGDNCGLHVIYSGTVGAAREAACKDVPALAFSLDNYKARTEEQYVSSAKYAVCIIKATLGVLPSAIPRPLLSIKGYVVNINFPGEKYEGEYKGLHLCFQGQHCSFPDFQEVDADPHFSAANGHGGEHELHAGKVTLRAFRNAAGFLRTDIRDGSDSWAVAKGWVSITPVGLRSDIPLTSTEASSRKDRDLAEALGVIMKSVAAELNVEVAGLPETVTVAVANGKV